MKLITLILITFLLIACSNSTIYEKNIEVNEKGWNYKDTLKYKFNIQNPQQNYNLLIHLKYLNTYTYSNLFFFVDVIDPENNKYRDTIECIMATPKGRWLGEKSGNYIEHEFMYRYNVNFPKKGNYKIKLQQAMRDTILKKISSVGLELRKFEKLN